jgi:hypothetical protein
VYLVVDPETRNFEAGYHWYRQDQGGGWSHKPGYSQVTNLDAKKQPISCPATADKDYSPAHNYSDDCGMMCAPN